MSGSKAPEATVAKKSGKARLLVIGLLAIILLGLAGGGVFWWTTQRGAEAAAATEDHASGPAASEVSGALEFEPFIVNLADPGTSRYLKADLRLVVSGVENIKELEEDKVTMLRLRSAILEYLSQQTADGLVTVDGKNALKNAIAERCSGILSDAKVTDVLFAEFVVQF